VILAIGSPLAGHWPDKLQHRPLLMVVTCWLFVLTSYPAFVLMSVWPSLAACIIAVGWLQLVKGGYSGVLPSVLSKQFPVDTRAIGISLSFSADVSIFGGLAPLVATWLIAVTGDRLSPSYYLVFTALLSLFALMALQWRSRP
jgi:MHS family proline/betaine transporter-like MFS transporter